jgi:putative tricarboxylic transport membrane protein
VISLSRSRWQDLVIGLVLLALGAGLCFGTFAVTALPGQDSLGPRLFPVLIGGGLVILGLVHLLQVWRGGTPAKETIIDGAPGELPPGHWPTLAWVIAGVAIGAAIYNFLGFLLAALTVFVLTARGFAGRFHWLHVLVGAVLVIIVYIGFTKGLGLRLPAGIFKGWF